VNVPEPSAFQAFRKFPITLDST